MAPRRLWQSTLVLEDGAPDATGRSDFDERLGTESFGAFGALGGTCSTNCCSRSSFWPRPF